MKWSQYLILFFHSQNKHDIIILWYFDFGMSGHVFYYCAYTDDQEGDSFIFFLTLVSVFKSWSGMT